MRRSDPPEGARTCEIMVEAPAPAPCRRFWLQILRGPRIGESIELVGRRMVLGRGADCEMCVVDSGLSRRHAAFEKGDRGWVVRDLGSRNGTFIDGALVDDDKSLMQGDRITLAETVLRYVVTDEEQVRSGPLPSLAPSHKQLERHDFSVALRDGQRRARRQGHTLAVWVIKLHGLQQARSRGGTRGAEDLVERCIRTVQEALGDPAVVTRHGRDQLAAFAARMNRQEAELCAQRFRARLGLLRLEEDGAQRVEPSVGVAVYLPEGSYRSDTELMTAAQRAADGALRAGGNRVVTALDPPQVTAPMGHR